MMKKLIRYRYILLFSIMLIVVSCLKTEDCPDTCYTPPAIFTLKIVNENGLNLINNIVYTPDSINIYSVNDNDSTDVKIYFEEAYDGYILSSGDLPREMMETNNPTFFIYLNISDTDTLTIEVVGKSDGCCIWHTYEKYQYNAADMEIDQEYYTFVGIK